MVSTPHPSSYGTNPNYIDPPITRGPQSQSFYMSPPKKQLVPPPKKPRRPSISTAAFYGPPKSKPVQLPVSSPGKR